MMNMDRFPDQILGSTHLDSQGERLSKSQLDKFCSACAGKRIPVHQQHDMRHGPVGYIDHLRVEPDSHMPGEWSLVGDVCVEHGSLGEVLKGFSISFTEPIREVEGAEVLIYLPYPFYNDTALIDTLSNDPKLTIGRWIKKQHDPNFWVAFGPTLVFVLRPAWDDFYRRKIAPLIDRFIKAHWPLLKSKGLHLEHVQLIQFGSHKIELRFIPPEDKGAICFAPELLRMGISAVEEHLKHEAQSASGRIVRVVLHYDVTARRYYIARVEHSLD
jgi:hypothetical protein